MEDLDFSEEEIQEQLAALGYGNVPKQRLREFKRDLDLLIRHEKSKSSTSAEWSSPKSHNSSCKSPPAFTKEKVQVPNAASKYNYIYSGNRAADQHTQVLTSTFNDENYDSMNLGPCDSYIKHTVAPRCIRPSTAPNRLEVQDASSDIYPSDVGASEPVRLQRDTHTNPKPVLKRKVLRKHRGHSQVCDESTYSEDSVTPPPHQPSARARCEWIDILFKFSKKENPGMYKRYYGYTFEEDKESLSFSFWTDQESEEPGECYVKDDGIKTDLGICKQEVNTENEHCVKDSTVNEQTGEKLSDCIKEDDTQYYGKAEDSGKLRDEQVSRHNEHSVKTPGQMCNSGPEGEKSDYIKKGCAGVPDSEHLMRETEKKEAQSKEEECDADKAVDETSQDEQSKRFVYDKTVSSEEESESNDLESDEEIEYFASRSSQGVMKCEEPEGEKFERDDEWKTFFSYQDDMSEPLRNNEQMCVEEGLIEQYPEFNMPFMAEQRLMNAVVSTDEADQMYHTHREKNGSTEQIWMYSSDPHETGVFNEDYHGSMSSLTASILTSGYGTYKPDSPKDEPDVGNDDSQSELELDTDYTQDDPKLSWYQGWLSSDVAEEQTPAVSPIRGDWSLFDSLVAADNCVYNDTDTVRENRLRSDTLCCEYSQRLPHSAESVDLPAHEEKATRSVHHQVTRTNNQNVTFCNEDWEDIKTFPVCTNEAFDTSRYKYMTKIKEHKAEDGHARQGVRKTKQRKSQEPVSELEDRLAQLHVSVPHDRYSESEETSSYSDRHSSVTEDLPTAFQDYIKGMIRSHSENDLRPRPKSFIRPVMDHPHTRNLKKTDPVTKYFQYKQDWEMFKPPGEKRRNELHWAIREQLAYQPPPPKPQRTYVPNTYVVPTEKKRSALRWEIRHDLANGIIPAKVTYM